MVYVFGLLHFIVWVVMTMKIQITQDTFEFKWKEKPKLNVSIMYESRSMNRDQS